MIGVSLTRCWFFVLLILLMMSASAFAQGQPQGQQTQTTSIEELQRQVDVLAQEVERMRSGEPEVEVTVDRARSLGLGSSASSVYRKAQGVSISGYGEMLYENFASRDEADVARKQGTQLDFLRAVLYFGYRFNEKFLFNSEIELEHANEVSVEFAYVDYMAHQALTLRGGMLLIPMGLTNEFHEPNAFIGAKRTETESRIIPSTWRENGFGIVGSAGKLSYRAYVVNGLNAAGFTSDGLRGGRQKGARARASDPGFVGRIDATPIPGALLGGSVYVGNSAQDQYTVAGEDLDVKTTIGEVHGQVQIRGFDLRGLYARATLNDVAALNTARGLTGANGIAEMMDGGYAQLGYNVLSQVSEQSSLIPFYRFERFNTQARTAPGFTASPATDRKYHSFGVQFHPISNVSVKSDYQWIRNEASTGLSQFNISLGYNF